MTQDDNRAAFERALAEYRDAVRRLAYFPTFSEHIQLESECRAGVLRLWDAQRAAPSASYADRVLRHFASVVCISSLLGEDTTATCECAGCAGRKYVELASVAAPTPGTGETPP